MDDVVATGVELGVGWAVAEDPEGFDAWVEGERVGIRCSKDLAVSLAKGVARSRSQGFARNEHTPSDGTGE